MGVQLQFELFVTGQLKLDNCAACPSIRCTEMGSFYSCFSTAFKTDSLKYILIWHIDFLISHFVIDMISNLVIGLSGVQFRE